MAAAEQVAMPSMTNDNMQPALHNIRPKLEDPLFCFVVRTYWGHGDANGGGLQRFLRSLQRQPHKRWEAVMLVADSKPFPDLHKIILDLNETRAWVFAEWIGPEFNPKENGTWAPNYHGILYNLTDDAIQVCPRNTQWLVVTNGDNEYADSFMTRVIQESSKPETPPDIIAFDFYSRFQRITMPACDRFALRPPPAPLCKRNSLKWCQFDLGAAALNWPRFKAENRSFGGVLGEDEESRELDADSADGLLMEVLARSGWKATHVTDKCLFAHNPSIQACAWQGGVWDDRDMILESGGICLTPGQADEILKKDVDAQDVVVHVANDGEVDAFQGAKQASMQAVRCLRHRNFKEESILGLTQVWYSKWCTDDEDLEEYERQLKEFYPTEEDLERAMDAAQEHADNLAKAKYPSQTQSQNSSSTSTSTNSTSGSTNTYISDTYDDYY